MHMVIRRFTVARSDTNEIARNVREGFIPIIRQASGFRGYYLLDTLGGVMVTVSIFETRAGAEESIRLAANWVDENLSHYISDPPEITAGEIVVQE